MPDVDEREGLIALQRAMAQVLASRDPVARLRELAGDPAAAPLRAVDQDGLRIATLLVTKLRFERLMQGSRLAAEWFERDGRGFTSAFARYHTAVPMVTADPWSEAAAFERWCAAAG